MDEEAAAALKHRLLETDGRLAEAEGDVHLLRAQVARLQEENEALRRGRPLVAGVQERGGGGDDATPQFTVVVTEEQLAGRARPLRHLARAPGPQAKPGSELPPLPQLPPPL